MNCGMVGAEVAANRQRLEAMSEQISEQAAELVLLRGMLEQVGERVGSVERTMNLLRRLVRRIRMSCDSIADAAEGISEADAA